MRKPLLLIAVATLATCNFSIGQSTCAQTLRLAQSVYDQGRLHELPQLLESCLQSGFTHQERVNAYKLLTLTYIYQEEPERADQMMLQLLQTENEFKVNDAVDPAEFVALYKTFRTAPVYGLGAKAGTIASKPSVVSADYVNDGVSEYKHRYGFTGAITAEIPLSGKLRKFILNPELGFQLRSFSSVNSGSDTVLTTTSIESQGAVTLPVTLQYNIYERKQLLNIYVSGGAVVDYLIYANKKIVSDRGAHHSPVNERTFNVNDQRKPVNAGILLGAGLKRRIGKGWLVTEMRYQMGLTSMLAKSDPYEDLVIVTDYKHIDGIFKLNTLSFTVGYVLNQYNPKKLTSK